MRETATKRRNRRRKSIAILLCVLMMLSLSACGMFASLDLTEEQSGLIAEYAAGLLKKYDRNGLRLMNPDAVKEPEKEEEPVPEEMPVEEMPVEDVAPPDQEEPSFEDMQALQNAEDMSVEDVSGEEEIYSAMPIGSYLNLQGIDVTYKEMEICDTYPDHPDNSWLISMSAREGKKLVVLRFSLTNTGDADADCDILNAGRQYRLIVNHEKRINETVTVLMDSFSHFNSTIPAGGTEEAVLIFELDRDLADSISALDLMIKDGQGSETFRLF